MMSNSSLVVHTNISPNKTTPRNHAIDTITIHCVVGQVTAESLGNVFKPTSRKASSNYGVDKDGRVGMYVEEKDRSWCTSSASNDNRAVTIEVASNKMSPYAVNDKPMAALIELCVDICKRNGIPRLLWKADKALIGQVDKQNMTAHRWFKATDCPGDFLYGRFGMIADEVNKKLVANGAPDTSMPKPDDSIMNQADFNRMADEWIREREQGAVSGWAADDWNRLTAERVFDGTMPQGFLTREQAAVIISRLRAKTKRTMPYVDIPWVQGGSLPIVHGDGSAATREDDTRNLRGDRNE